MAFTLGKKGTEWNPRDPRNRHIAHPNPGGGDNPPPDPATTAAAGVRNIDRGVLSAAATSLVAGGRVERGYSYRGVLYHTTIALVRTGGILRCINDGGYTIYQCQAIFESGGIGTIGSQAHKGRKFIFLS